ncbi:hypothetical protein Moror_3518 [Moniliophthora roreri MCA 2997]|uniref:CCHC-type domain-containing protein n=1 Tax=Moniliophthora roreri (strain MCA 2997) TaxID=1381753 RepID=V2XRK4_MONRO|nr:hypothetical protein Moror_3518 [Moniliophthora roreri MCA 2997]
MGQAEDDEGSHSMKGGDNGIESEQENNAIEREPDLMAAPTIVPSQKCLCAETDSPESRSLSHKAKHHLPQKLSTGQRMAAISNSLDCVAMFRHRLGTTRHRHGQRNSWNKTSPRRKRTGVGNQPNPYRILSPSLTSQPLTETPVEDSGTRRISTPSFTPTGLKPIEHEEGFSPNIPKPSDLGTSNTSTDSLEELDPFQKLLKGLKNSPRLPKTQPETMAEDKKPSGSRPKREEPAVEEAIIGSAMPVQVVSVVKEVKAALLRAFTGAQKDAKKFLREVLIYVALNPKAFPDDRSKKLFLLSYMTDGPGEFWKNDKTDLLLAYDVDAEKVTWAEFLDNFRTSFEPLDPALKAQLKLKDLRMKERADEYTYQFTYLAKQTGYNDAAQIVAFKRGLPRSLALKIMTRPEGALTTIKDWMNAAILFDESYKQALEYRKTWDDKHGGKKPQRSFRKKEDVAIKQITEIDRKEYMSKGLCFRCGRPGHRIKDCPDMPKKDE